MSTRLKAPAACREDTTDNVGGFTSSISLRFPLNPSFFPLALLSPRQGSTAEWDYSAIRIVGEDQGILTPRADTRRDVQPKLA